MENHWKHPVSHACAGLHCLYIRIQGEPVDILVRRSHSPSPLLWSILALVGPILHELINLLSRQRLILAIIWVDLSCSRRGSVKG